MSWPILLLSSASLGVRRPRMPGVMTLEMHPHVEGLTFGDRLSKINSRYMDIQVGEVMTYANLRVCLHNLWLSF
jgi:hypothetical protein